MDELRQEDDFEHYFNATKRLSEEIARLRGALEDHHEAQGGVCPTCNLNLEDK